MKMRTAIIHKLALTIGLILALTQWAWAQDVARPVTSSFTLGIGSAHVADTYLTPLHYRGTSWLLDYRRMQAARFSPERFTTRLGVSLDLGHTHNPAGNGKMWDAMLGVDWSLMRRWSVINSLTLAAGGEIALKGGAFYNARNGNNPASAKASATLGLTGFAAYDFRIGRLPVRAIYEPSIPVVGAFFAPEYGQLYYEIYLGERRNLAHCAWWGNYFALDHLLALDLRLGSTSLRLGYQGKLLSTHINHVVTRSFSHMFVIGVTTEWLSINPRKTSPIPLIHAL